MNEAKEITYRISKKNYHAHNMMYLIAEIQRKEGAALIRGEWIDQIDRDELIPVYRAVEFHDPNHDGRADDADQYVECWVPEEVDSPRKIPVGYPNPETGKYAMKYTDEIIADTIFQHIKEGRTDCEIGISVNVSEDNPLYETGYYDGIEQACERWFNVDLLTGKHNSKATMGYNYGEYTGA